MRVVVLVLIHGRMDSKRAPSFKSDSTECIMFKLISCGNIFPSTILVSPTFAYSICNVAHTDSRKSNNDTLHLDAPDGFLNYTWSNNYNISSTSAQHVVVNPSSDDLMILLKPKNAGF